MSPVLQEEVPEPPSSGRGCRRRRRRIAAFRRKAEAPQGPGLRQTYSCIYSVFLSPIGQLHSGRANKRKAIPNFSFPLEGNAAKRQRVYEGKNDNVAPLLLYAGPTLPDLAILCRIAACGRSLTLPSSAKTVKPRYARGKCIPPFGTSYHLPLRSSVGRQKESALMGRLGALFRPTCTSYAGCAQWDYKAPISNRFISISRHRLPPH